MGIPRCMAAALLPFSRRGRRQEFEEQARAVDEAEKEEKRIKKEARRDIEHASKQAYDYHYQARADDI